MAATHEGRPAYLVVGALLAVLVAPVGLVVAVWQAYRDPVRRSWWILIAVVAAVLTVPMVILIASR